MTYTNRVLCVALATAGAMMFVGLWLGIDMVPPPAAPIVQAPEPCKRLADLPMRKAYSESDINSLCEHQEFDSRFHAPTNPKRITRDE